MSFSHNIDKEHEMHARGDRLSPPSRRAIWLTAALIFLAVLGLRASTAHAGSYNVHYCHPGIQTSAPPAEDVIYGESYGSYSHWFDCGGISPPGLAVQAPGSMTPPWGYTAVGQYVFVPPPGTTFGQVAFDWHGCSQQVQQAFAYVAWDGGSSRVQPSFNQCWGLRDYHQAIVFGRAEDDLNAFVFGVECPGSCPFTQTSPGPLYPWNISAARNINIVVKDTSRPTIAALGGGLFAGGIRHGSESVRIQATDEGGGVATASLAVNGNLVASLGADCNLDGQHMRPCPRDAQLDGAIDTSQAPWHTGANAVRVCVRDFSENNTSAGESCEEKSVQVDNTCPDSAGAPSAFSLDGGLVDPVNDETRTNLELKSTDSRSVRGRLVGPGGSVANATVCIYERIDTEDAMDQMVTQIKTRGDGTFGTRLDPGPSRALTVLYRDNNRIVERQLRISSAVVPTFKVNSRIIRNGHLMKFSGKLPPPRAESRGVTIQAKVGKQWRTFKQLRTDGAGNYKGRYRFKHSTVARAKYTFRALVKKQNGYPFAAGESSKRKILVLG